MRTEYGFSKAKRNPYAERLKQAVTTSRFVVHITRDMNLNSRLSDRPR